MGLHTTILPSTYFLGMAMLTANLAEVHSFLGTLLDRVALLAIDLIVRVAPAASDSGSCSASSICTG